MSIALLRESGMAAHVFHEVLGFNLPDAAARGCARRDRLDGARRRTMRVRANITPHAPYSVSPAMFRRSSESLAGATDAVTSVHLGESPEEVEFLRTGGGGIRAALERSGRGTRRGSRRAAGRWNTSSDSGC